MSIRVRLATEKDAESLSRLNQAFNGGQAIPPDTIRGKITSNNELIAVGIVDGEVVGFACAQEFASFCYSTKQGEITEMFVEESARRLGLASKMIHLLEEELYKRGVHHVKLLTGKKNEAAIKTYIKSGYQLEDDVILEKRL